MISWHCDFYSANDQYVNHLFISKFHYCKLINLLNPQVAISTYLSLPSSSTSDYSTVLILQLIIIIIMIRFIHHFLRNVLNQECLYHSAT